MRRGWMLSVLGLVSLMLLAADAQPIKPGITLSGKPAPKDDTLLMYYGQDPDFINPILANDTVSDEFLRWVYEPLADRKYSNPDEFEMKLAESYTFNEEKLEFVIKLRKGIKWHPMKLPSGKELPATEFKARDVKFTFDCILNRNTNAASLRSYYTDPEAEEESKRIRVKVTVIDDYTVKVKWTQPYFLAEEFTLLVPIIPRHVFSMNAEGKPISFDFMSAEFAKGFNEHWANNRMCGTGPMIMQEYTRDTRLELTRNPNYWGHTFPFSRVVFTCIPNTNTAAQKVIQTELDWASVPEKDLYLQLKEREPVKAGAVKPAEYPFPAYRYIGYNVERPFFSDRKVRLALSHSVPVQQIIDEVWKKLATRTTGTTLPGSSAYDSSLPPIPFDLEKARSLLTEAGWVDADGDGVREKTINGKVVKASYQLMMFSDSAQFQTVGEIIKERQRQIGVEVQLEPAKWALMLQKLRKKEFDAAMLGWALSWKQDLFQIWHSSQADLPESSNSIHYKNPEMDKLIDQMRVTFDPAMQQKLYHQMHRILYEDQPYTFLFQEMRTGFYDGRIDNFRSYAIRPCIDPREWSTTRPRMIGR